MVGEGCFLQTKPNYPKIQRKYRRTTHKFGITLPKTVEEAYEIDQKKGTTYWKIANEKETANACVDLNVLKVVTTEQIIDRNVKP